MRPRFPQAPLQGRRLLYQWLPPLPPRPREDLPQPCSEGALLQYPRAIRGEGVWGRCGSGVCVWGGCAQLPLSSGIHWQVATAALANFRWVLPSNCFNFLIGNNKTVIS